VFGQAKRDRRKFTPETFVSRATYLFATWNLLTYGGGFWQESKAQLRHKRHFAGTQEGSSTMLVLILFLDFVAAFFVGLAFGAATAWVAMRKGYQPIAGLVVGTVIGPPALVVYLFLPRTVDAKQNQELENKIATEQSEAAKTRLCPKCRRVLSVTARVCPKCETRFESTTESATT
jgi:hypothetical protein